MISEKKKRKDDNEMSFSELVRKSDVPARTIRYYISKGLVEPPLRSGRDAAYDHTHLERLKQIRELKNQQHSLREIRRILTLGEVEPDLLPPTNWWTYQIAEDIIVNIRSDAGAWRTKQALKLVRALVEELGKSKVD